MNKLSLTSIFLREGENSHENTTGTCLQFLCFPGSELGQGEFGAVKKGFYTQRTKKFRSVQVRYLF